MKCCTCAYSYPIIAYGQQRPAQRPFYNYTFNRISDFTNKKNEKREAYGGRLATCSSRDRLIAFTKNPILYPPLSTGGYTWKHRDQEALEW